MEVQLSAAKHSVQPELQLPDLAVALFLVEIVIARRVLLQLRIAPLVKLQIGLVQPARLTMERLALQVVVQRLLALVVLLLVDHCPAGSD